MEQDNKKEFFKIIPKFNFIYELGMPTGKKIRSSLVLITIFIVGMVIFSLNKTKLNLDNVSGFNNINVEQIISIVLLVAAAFSVVKLVFHIVFQTWQYKSITYTFYQDNMIYEDSFLNQHRKNIMYSNVKEIEIRRTVWDRIMGYGIIIICTNAENEYSNGLVIYSIKQPQEIYKKVDSIIHKKSKVDKVSIDKSLEIKNEVEEIKEEDNKISNDDENIKGQSGEDFLESLKNINKD